MKKNIYMSLFVFFVILIACQDSRATEISFNGTSIDVSGDGVTVNNSTATITSEGTYRIAGNLTDGQLIVDTSDDGDVVLEFNGIDIFCSTSAPVFVMNAEKVIIDLLDSTENNLSDKFHIYSK